MAREHEPPDAGRMFEFRPGQFNMLYLFGVGESAISMSGDPAAANTITHTIRDVGAVTRGLCDLRKGDAVGVRGPFGTAWPLAEAEGNDVVVIAGGIGLAPLRPAIYQLMAERRQKTASPPLTGPPGSHGLESPADSTPAGG